MAWNEIDRDYCQRSLRAIGLGPIFRKVIFYSDSFPIMRYLTEFLIPQAKELEFEVHLIDLTMISQTSVGTHQRPLLQNVQSKVNDFLNHCEKRERRPLLIVNGSHHLKNVPNLTAYLRTQLDMFDTTAVLFTMLNDQEVFRHLFLDQSQPMYCSASFDAVVLGK